MRNSSKLSEWRPKWAGLASRFGPGPGFARSPRTTLTCSYKCITHKAAMGARRRGGQCSQMPGTLGSFPATRSSHSVAPPPCACVSGWLAGWAPILGAAVVSLKETRGPCCSQPSIKCLRCPRLLEGGLFPVLPPRDSCSGERARNSGAVRMRPAVIKGSRANNQRGPERPFPKASQTGN